MTRHLQLSPLSKIPNIQKEENKSNGRGLQKGTRLSKVARISGGILGEEKALTRLLTNCSWCIGFSCDQQLTKPAANNSRATKGFTQPMQTPYKKTEDKHMKTKLNQMNMASTIKTKQNASSEIVQLPNLRHSLVIGQGLHRFVVDVMGIPWEAPH